MAIKTDCHLNTANNYRCKATSDHFGRLWLLHSVTLVFKRRHPQMSGITGRYNFNIILRKGSPQGVGVSGCQSGRLSGVGTFDQ